jgi:hypothetical protein
MDNISREVQEAYYNKDKCVLFDYQNNSHLQSNGIKLSVENGLV